MFIYLNKKFNKYIVFTQLYTYPIQLYSYALKQVGSCKYQNLLEI